MEKEINKISVIGAVRSGLAAAKLAKRQGIDVFVSDSASYEKLKDNFDKLKELGIDYEFGGHSEKIYDADLIVTSPGVPSDSDVIKNALNKGLQVISELEFASRFCKGNIIGITGTNGKTTTTTLCAHVLNECGFKTYTAGNIGFAFSEIADRIKPDEFVSLEISSFQLDFINEFAPKFAVLLNITPDHMDRYDNSLDNYARAKFNITINQSDEDYFILDKKILQEYEFSTAANSIAISTDGMIENGIYADNDKIYSNFENEVEQLCSRDDISLKGEHNLQNALAVIAVAKLLNADVDKMRTALKSFKGVEHRLEFVREIEGVSFINDSKATNVDSVFYALQSFDKPIRLILGGKDKGNDYNQIKELVKKNVIKIYAIGSSKEKVKSFFENIVNVHVCESMEDAVNSAFKDSNAGEVILLSPACASFDMFDNYEHRGEVFKRIVGELCP